MTTSDWIQSIAILTSLIVALISILQTRAAAKTTERTIQEANRPNIALYVETLDTIYFHKYIVLKNFGNTSATIIDLTFEGELDEYNNKFRMETLIGGTVAPQQKFTSSLETKFEKTIVGSITYKDFNEKTYTESFAIKTDMASKLFWESQTNSSDTAEAAAIKNAAQAIIKTIK